MMNRVRNSVASLAVVLMAGSALGSAPGLAFAQGTSGNAGDTAAQRPIDKAEARINEMHAKLKITPAQDPQWQDFVNAQRQNAEQMSALIEKRDEGSASMNAVEDFKNYEDIVQAHADGLKTVIPAFEKLYNALSPEQKKMADTMFRNAQEKKS
jgi:Spy/CpxP family protein refolding chaperone